MQDMDKGYASNRDAQVAHSREARQALDTRRMVLRKNISLVDPRPAVTPHTRLSLRLSGALVTVESTHGVDDVIVDIEVGSCPH
jgi:hypothetical protein